MPDPLPPASRFARVAPWLVGLYALWQLVYFPLGNLLEFVPLRPTRYDVDPPIETTQRWGQFTDIEPLQYSVERVGALISAWGEVSGQEQGWNMFTPGFPPHTVLAVAEFHFPDGSSARVDSRFEPADPANPRPRWPIIH